MKEAKAETIQMNQQSLLQGNPHAQLVGYELNNATGRSHNITKPLSGGRVLKPRQRNSEHPLR